MSANISNKTFDTLFSLYANSIILTYMVNLLIHKLDKTKNKIKLTKNNLIFIIRYNLSAEILFWIISQNSENIFLPSILKNISILEDIYLSTLINIENFFNVKISTKKTLIKNMIKELQLDKVFPQISKYHVPPLVSKNINKDYEIQQKNKKNNVIISLDNPNNILFKYPIETVQYSTLLYTTESVIYSRINLRYSISKNDFNKFKKIYIG